MRRLRGAFVDSTEDKAMIRLQKDFVNWLLRNPETWLKYGRDVRTVEVVCSLSNLGIAEIKADHVILKSKEKAKRFLSQGA